MVQWTKIQIEGIGAVILEKSSKARYVNITVKPLKGVRVAVPKNVSFATAEQIARSKSDWIKSHGSRMKKVEQKYRTVSNTTITIDREKANKILAARVKK